MPENNKNDIKAGTGGEEKAQREEGTEAQKEDGTAAEEEKVGAVPIFDAEDVKEEDTEEEADVSNKAELDTEGIDVNDSEPDKAVLDTDEIIDVSSVDKPALDADDIFKGLDEIDFDDAEQPAKQDLQKGSEENQQADASKEKKVFLKNITDKPWFKYAVISLGTVLLFSVVWIMVSYYFSPKEKEALEPPKSVAVQHKEPAPFITNIQLKPFIVPFYDGKKGSVFVRFKIGLYFKDVHESTVKNKLKNIRLAVYMIMKEKNVSDISNIRGRDRMITELKNGINNTLSEGNVIEISLIDILII